MSRPDAAAPVDDGLAAREAEVVRHAPAVLAFLKRHAGDAATGSDLAQDVLETAFRRLMDVASAAAVRPWLFRIAINRFHDHVRRGVRLRPLEDRADSRSEASPERAALKQEMEEVLRRGVAGLPERQRGVFLLHGVEGFDHSAIAAALELSPGAVKTALYHAREKLRVVLGRYLGADDGSGVAR